MFQHLTTRACIWGRAEGGILPFIRFAEGLWARGVFTHAEVFLRGNDLQQRENGGDRFTMVARCHYGPFFAEFSAIMPRGGKYNILGFIHLSVITIRARGKIRELNSRIRS